MNQNQLYNIPQGAEFVYTGNKSLDNMASYLAKRQVEMFAHTFMKCDHRGYCYKVIDGEIQFGFLHDFYGDVEIELTGREVDLAFEAVKERLHKGVDHYEYYMESQTGNRQDKECNWDTKAWWGNGVFAYDPDTEETFCLRSDYDSSG